MIAEIITQLKRETQINPVLAPKLLDKIILRHMRAMQQASGDLVTWYEAFHALIPIFEKAHTEISNKEQFIWKHLVDQSFEKLSREEECPITTNQGES